MAETVFLSARTVGRILLLPQGKSLTHPTIFGSSSSSLFCTVLLFEALDSNGISGIHKFISPRTIFDFFEKGIEKKFQQTMQEKKKRFMRFEIFIMSFLRFKAFFHL